MAFYYFYIPNIITKSLALCMLRLWSLTVLKLFFDNQRVFADVILYGSVVEEYRVRVDVCWFTQLIIIYKPANPTCGYQQLLAGEQGLGPPWK